MGYFEFPHTRTYDSDLGWIIRTVKKLIENNESLDRWRAEHEKEYEDLLEKVNGLINHLIDPIEEWDSSREYLIYSMVKYNGNTYIAIQDVPVGIMITNTDYWVEANTILEQLGAIAGVTDELQDAIDEINEYLQNETLDCDIEIYTDTWNNHAIYTAKVKRGILKAIFNDSDPVVGSTNPKGDPRAFQMKYKFPLLCGTRLTGPYSINGSFTSEANGEGLYYMAWDRVEEKGFNVQSILNGYNPETLAALGSDGISIWGPILENGIEHVYTQNELNKEIAGGNTFGEYTYNGKLSRCFYGIDSENNLYMCVNAGRSFADLGMTWQEVLRYCAYKSFRDAYMLDGGRSVDMFSGAVKIIPSVSLARHFFTVEMVIDTEA